VVRPHAARVESDDTTNVTPRKIQLSLEASHALLEIYEYTKTEFGRAQARKYLAGFRKSLDQRQDFSRHLERYLQLWARRDAGDTGRSNS